MTPEQRADMAHRIADRAVVADIESECHAVPDEHGVGWWDTRTMLDPREMPDDFIEMARQTLAYADARGLIYRHPAQQHLVRINPARLQDDIA